MEGSRLVQDEISSLDDKPSDLSAAPEKPLSKPSRRKMQVRAFFVGALLGAVAFFFWPVSFHSLTSKSPDPDGARSSGSAEGKGKGKGKKGSGAGVRKGGIGGVTPIYRVTVKSRVDGERTKVLFPNDRW
jgi:hypothetical protein